MYIYIYRVRERETCEYLHDATKTNMYVGMRFISLAWCNPNASMVHFPSMICLPGPNAIP